MRRKEIDIDAAVDAIVTGQRYGSLAQTNTQEGAAAEFNTEAYEKAIAILKPAVDKIERLQKEMMDKYGFTIKHIGNEEYMFINKDGQNITNIVAKIMGIKEAEEEAE